VTGDYPGSILVAPTELLDEEDVIWLEQVTTWLAALGLSIKALLDSDPDDQSLPEPVLSLCRYLQYDLVELPYPTRCKCSPVALLDSIDPMLAEVWSKPLTPADKRLDAVALTEADYFAALGQFDDYCALLWQRWQQEEIATVQDSFEKLRHALLSGILDWRVGMQKRRDWQTCWAKGTGPLPPNYFTLFDALNYEEPLAVGMVRQSNGNSGFQAIYEGWRYNLVDESLPVWPLIEQGWDVERLCLVKRVSTPDEVEAYEALSALEGKTMRCLVFKNGAAHGAPARGFEEWKPLGTLPPVLQRATFGKKVPALFVRASDWTTNDESATVFDVISKMATPQGTWLRQHLIDIDAVTMLSFAESASQSHCTEPVVLASGLHQDWVFSAEGGHWSAHLVHDDWSVSLHGGGRTLEIRLTAGKATHAQWLATEPPASQQNEFDYRGQLHSVLPFMEHLQNFKRTGIEPCWIDEEDLKGPPWANKRLVWLAHLVWDCLLLNSEPGELGRADDTTWPELSW
jgi:hypothetical protein